MPSLRTRMNYERSQAQQALTEVVEVVQAAVQFRGAMARKAANQTGADYTTATPVTWDQEVYDTDGFHDNATNPSRITIPAGASKVRLSAQVIAGNMTADEWFFASIRKNGAAGTDWNGVGRSLTESGFTSAVANIVSGVTPVSAGDYFEVYAQVEADTSIDIFAGSSWFAVEVVE